MTQNAGQLFEADAPFTDYPPGPAPVILDRSTAERWANCPHQAYHVGRGLVSNGGTDADVGSAVHEILARACHSRHADATPFPEVREFIDFAASESRPDLQPAVVDALRRCYPIASLLCHLPNGTERHPEDLLRYDGGEGPHAGQLAGDLIEAKGDGSRGAVRLTAEVDLLMAGASSEELELYELEIRPEAVDRDGREGLVPVPVLRLAGVPQLPGGAAGARAGVDDARGRGHEQG